MADSIEKPNAYRFERWNGDAVVVERVQRSRRRTAEHITNIIRSAYRREFVGRQGLVKQADITRGLISDFASIRHRTKRMNEQIAQGTSSYWLAYEELVDDLGQERVGVVQASPLPRRWRILGADRCYIDEVATTVPQQGIGSAMLYAATSDYDLRSEVMLDAYKESTRTNEWFESLGLRPKPRSRVEPVEFGSKSLEMIRYGDVSVSDFLIALEGQAPFLKTAEHF